MKWVNEMDNEYNLSVNLSHMRTGEDFLHQKVDAQCLIDEGWGACRRPIQVLMLAFWG